RLIRELADLLDHAHRRGVIHRGLRPDRIVMTPDRRFPLCIPDWSEAIAHDATSHLPAAPSETGQPYVAPEMLGAEPGVEQVDDRVDMFALGVIGHRALTGILPLEADPDRDGLYVRTAQRRPDAPVELYTILDSLLSFDRFDRPSASEVRSDVDWLLATISQVQRHAAVSNDFKRGNMGFDPRTPGERVQIDQPRLRRPRWTPHIQPLERLEHTTSGIHSVEDGRIKD
ncbi:MAG TPA: hypothetical protein VGC42_03720, partial [Kofleriaceae bacterium]